MDVRSRRARQMDRREDRWPTSWDVLRVTEFLEEVQIVMNLLCSLLWDPGRCLVFDGAWDASETIVQPQFFMLILFSWLMSLPVSGLGLQCWHVSVPGDSLVPPIGDVCAHVRVSACSAELAAKPASSIQHPIESWRPSVGGHLGCRHRDGTFLLSLRVSRKEYVWDVTVQRRSSTGSHRWFFVRVRRVQGHVLVLAPPSDVDTVGRAQEPGSDCCSSRQSKLPTVTHNVLYPFVSGQRWRIS